jgi:Chitin binding Peritrophin-A domain
MLGIFHAALLISLAHGFTTTTTTTTISITSTTTVTIATLPSQPTQKLFLQSPTNPESTVLFECPAKCNGGAACEFVNPTNCNEYINCDSRRGPLVMVCEEGLHFWQQMRQCAPPSQAKCKLELGLAGKGDL